LVFAGRLTEANFDADENCGVVTRRTRLHRFNNDK
jgi:hypothetical protein